MSHEFPVPMRLQRSELAVPSTHPKFFAKAAAGNADGLFFDLEDAVAPDRKAQARQQAIEAINGHDWGAKTVAVRVNGLDTPWALLDIVEVARSAPRLDLILLPKASCAFDVQFVAQLLTHVERETGRRKRTGIEVLIETARGVANVEAIAQASDRLEAMIFGVGDYSVDMRTGDRVFGRPSPDCVVLSDPDAEGRRERHWSDQWHFAMARVANACRAWGLRPIDGPFTDYRDADGFRVAALRARSLGFEGKWAIHPSQIELANAAFSPSADELAWATRTNVVMARATREGQGAAGADGVLVDMAHLKLTEALAQRQALIERTEVAQQRSKGRSQADPSEPERPPR